MGIVMADVSVKWSVQPSTIIFKRSDSARVYEKWEPGHFLVPNNKQAGEGGGGVTCVSSGAGGACRAGHHVQPHEALQQVAVTIQLGS